MCVCARARDAAIYRALRLSPFLPLRIGPAGAQGQVLAPPKVHQATKA